MIFWIAINKTLLSSTSYHLQSLQSLVAPHLLHSLKHSIITLDDITTVYREMVMGKPMPISSNFKLSYYTLLNLMRRGEGTGQDMEYVIARSFQQFQFESNLPKVRTAFCCIPDSSPYDIWSEV